MGLMEDSFIFRGKVPDDKHRLKIWLNGKSRYIYNTDKYLDNIGFLSIYSPNKYTHIYI